MSDASENNGDVVLCLGERNYFPVNEFIKDHDGHPWIHDTEYQHYVADGALVTPGGQYGGLGVLHAKMKTTPGKHPAGLGLLTVSPLHRLSCTILSVVTGFVPIKRIGSGRDRKW